MLFLLLPPCLLRPRFKIKRDAFLRDFTRDAASSSTAADGSESLHLLQGATQRHCYSAIDRSFLYLNLHLHWLIEHIFLAWSCYHVPEKESQDSVSEAVQLALATSLTNLLCISWFFKRKDTAYGTCYIFNSTTLFMVFSGLYSISKIRLTLKIYKLTACSVSITFVSLETMAYRRQSGYALIHHCSSNLCLIEAADSPRPIL